MKKQFTLCILRNNDSVLLGMKKRGFGEGKWNGFGGKVEAGESFEEAAVREIREESGLIVSVSAEDKVGVIEFVYENSVHGTHEVHIYAATSFYGNVVETQEMKSQWFEVDSIPYSEMWEDDRHWLPLLLEGKKINGVFIFDKNKKLISHTLECTS